MTRELLQQALDALEAMQSCALAEKKGLRICDEAVEALRAELAKPEQPTPAWNASITLGGRCEKHLKPKPCLQCLVESHATYGAVHLAPSLVCFGATGPCKHPDQPREERLSPQCKECKRYTPNVPMIPKFEGGICPVRIPL